MIICPTCGLEDVRLTICPKCDTILRKPKPELEPWKKQLLTLKLEG